MVLSIAALILVVIGLFVGYKWFTNFGNAGAQQSVAATEKLATNAPAAAPAAPTAPPDELDLTDGVKSVATTSFAPPSGGRAFNPRNLVDGKVETAWRPAPSAKNGEGQVIKFEFAKPLEVSALEIANGDQLGDNFEKNGRMLQGRVELPGGKVIPLHCDQSQKGFARFEPDQRARVDKFYIVVEKVYPGRDSRNLAISEIKIKGRK